MRSSRAYAQKPQGHAGNRGLDAEVDQRLVRPELGQQGNPGGQYQLPYRGQRDAGIYGTLRMLVSLRKDGTIKGSGYPRVIRQYRAG